MSRKYLRRVRLEIVQEGGSRLIAEELRIAFEIRRESQPDEGPSNIKVYNLSERTAMRIQAGDRARLSAGYGNSLALLYEGEIQRVEQERTGMERVTTLNVGTARKVSEALYSGGKSGALPLKVIVIELVLEMGFGVGPLDAIPDERVEGWAEAGAAADALTTLLRPRGVEWYEEGGEIRFSRQGMPSRSPEFLLSEATGLIGTPSVTDTGARASMRVKPILS